MGMTRRDKAPPLLCELHAHTTWSDGVCSVARLVDIYGLCGFDVLAVTDHVLPRGAAPGVDEERFTQYLAEVDREADRALKLYGLLVVPGLELTWNDLDPDRAAHAVAVGLREFVSMDDGFDAALVVARRFGAALIAAHPHDTPARRRTRRFFVEGNRLAPLVDRFELFNQRELFHWVAAAGLPVVATGDFHRPEHLESWKTLLPCAKDERAVVQYLASPRPAYLVPIGPAVPAVLAA